MADRAIWGVSSAPSCFRYASSVWQPRAAYARTPRLPTSPNGVILGITAVTVMSSPARRDSSWAYPAMNARAIPRPRPRLGPTTTVVLPGRSLIIVLFLCVFMVPAVSASGEVGGAAFRTRHGLWYSSWRRHHRPVSLRPWRAVEPLVHAPEAVQPALVRRVGVVDDAVLDRERAHAGPFSPVRL